MGDSVVANKVQISERFMAALGRYRDLKQHRDSQYQSHLARLQAWQKQRMQETHGAFLTDARYKEACEFVLNDVYGATDLTGLFRDIERAMGKAIRVLPASVMDTSVVALELFALSSEMDEMLVDILFYKMQVDTLDERAFMEACRLCDNLDLRYQQAELMTTLGRGLDKYIRSRVLYTVFKMTKVPAHRAGVGILYGFVGKGFKVMRKMDSAHDFISLLVEKEVQVYERALA